MRKLLLALAVAVTLSVAMQHEPEQPAPVPTISVEPEIRLPSGPYPSGPCDFPLGYDCRWILET